MGDSVESVFQGLCFCEETTTAEQLFHVELHQLMHPCGLFSLILLPAVESKKIDLPPFPA